MKYLGSLALLTLSLGAYAHHSRIQYDTTAIVEMSTEELRGA